MMSLKNIDFLGGNWRAGRWAASPQRQMLSKGSRLLGVREGSTCARQCSQCQLSDQAWGRCGHWTMNKETILSSSPASECTNWVTSAELLMYSGPFLPL